jgi:hypothetical protein
VVPGLDPRTEKRTLVEKLGNVNKFRSEFYCISVNFIDVANVSWVHKMLTLEKAGQQIYGNTLCYLCDFP